MRKNVFIKSILRQPTRSLLLILLIGLASFAFVLRTVEYVVVRNQIIEISGFYRSIGFLYADTVFGDISQAAEIIRESPHVEFIDQRRTFEGILRDFRNPDFEGMRLWESRENSPRLTDAFFYGELLEIDTGELSETDNMPGQGIVWLRFVIDDVETAYDEHASEGQQLWVRYRHRLREDIGTIADFEVGQRYFIRAFAYFRPGNYGMGVMPVIGRSDPLEIMPLNYEAIAADETDAPLYFIPVSPGERLNFAEIPDLQHLPRLFNEIEHNQRAMILQTTSEMAILPIMQGRPVIRLNDGRLIDYNDNLEGNHVAVINSEFARIRNLQIGDTITLTVPSVQRFDRFFAAFLQSYPEDPGGMFRDLRVTSEFEEVTEVEIELEIVGTYHYAMFGMGGRQTLTIFIPDSIIPDIEILPPLNPVGFQENWQSGHIPDSWFTFTISDSRLEQEFYVEYSEIFQEMGLDLVLLGTDAGNFWASADVIMLIVTFNAVIFWILLIFVLLLVAFLYLRQRSRDLAIMRGLGTSPVVILGRLCVSVLLLGLPAIMVGGVIAWTFGLEAAANTMMPLAQIADVTIVSELHMGWYFVFIGVVFGFALTFTAIGAAFILKSPVLELLQGRIVVFKPRENKKGKVETAEPPKDTKVAGFSFADIDFTEFSKSLKGRIVNSANWIYRHIMRSKLKTILGLSVALLFVVALGWLQEAINRTSAEIDHLYDTTIVFADVRPAQPPSGFVAREVGHLTPGYHISGTVSRHLVNQIRQRPYSENINIEAGHMRSFVVPTDSEGNFPQNWREIIDYDSSVAAWFNLSSLNFLYAFNDYESFLNEHSRGFDDRFLGDIALEFAEGFGPEIFAVGAAQDGQPVPIVVYEGTLEQRGIEIGEVVALAFARGMDMTMPEYTMAVIAGTHNGNIYRDNLGEAVLIPLSDMERLLGSLMSYVTLNFTTDTQFNRDIALVRAQLEHLVPQGGFVRLSLFFLDEELRNVVSAMAQTLMLLELLYPIAIALSIAIGAGLSMLLMLQAAKNAAIMRVLGITRRKTQAMLIFEQIAICLEGVLLGVAFLIIIGWGFGVVPILTLGGMYLAGAVVGCILGGFMVTGKSPLELLQVRE